MKKSKDNKLLIVFSAVFYIITASLMLVGTFKDLTVNIMLFNPESSVSRFFESFGQVVYWGLWGPAFTIIFLCRRDLNESLGVIGKIIPFVKPVKNTEHGAYKFFNMLLKIITAAAFFVLAVIGWKKLIENVLKNIVGEGTISQAVYFIICAVFAAIMIFVFSKIDKNILRKLEALALAGVLLGIFYKIVEECKNITSRVRFREMVAYSNHFLNDKGLSEGKYSPLTSAMAENSDFSAFTNWYKIGNDMGIYSRADSFPSGHTNYGCTLFLTYPLCLAFDKLKKVAPFALSVSFLYVAFMGFTRIIAGAHYLTDVAGAAIIGYTLFLVVYKIYNVFTEKKIIG